MSQKLAGLIAKKIEAEGPTARLKLALSIKRTERMITLYVQGVSLPRQEQAYTLAKECGASEEDAREIEREHFHKPAKETA